ncbi:MAG: GntR family transcriptional regulator [Acidimicrobiales bacterium]
MTNESSIHANVLPAEETSEEDRRPLWQQVRDDLLARVAQGEIADRFPTDREIVARYGVSRHTAREAVRHIAETGMIERRRGRGGTTLRSTEFIQPLGSLYSLFQAIEAQGVRQHSKVLSVATACNDEIAGLLDRPEDTPLFLLERVRFAGQHSIAIDRAWMPLEIAEPLLGADFTHTALYDELRTRCGIVIDSGSEEIWPEVIDGEEASLLAIPDGSLGFRINRVGRAGGKPVEIRRSLLRADRTTLSVNWGSDGEGSSTEFLPGSL